jgi:TRAP-type C4-dicarboxylate transport system permease small subunit
MIAGSPGLTGQTHLSLVQSQTANKASLESKKGPQVIDVVARVVDGTLAITRTAAGLCLLSSVAVNFGNMIGRYFFSVSFPWAEEIMLFLMVGCVFTGCCAVAWEGRQIRMDIVVQMLPTRIREALLLVSDLVLVASAALVSFFTWPVVSQLAAFDQRSQAANFPLFIPQAMIPAGYALMAVLVALRLLSRRRPEADPSYTERP